MKDASELLYDSGSVYSKPPSSHPLDSRDVDDAKVCERERSYYRPRQTWNLCLV